MVVALVFVFVVTSGCATRPSFINSTWHDPHPEIGMPGVDRVIFCPDRNGQFATITVETKKPAESVFVIIGSKNRAMTHRGGFVWSVKIKLAELCDFAKEEGVVVYVSPCSPVTGYPGTAEYLLDLRSGRLGPYDEKRGIAQQINDLRAISPPYVGRGS